MIVRWADWGKQLEQGLVKLNKRNSISHLTDLNCSPGQTYKKARFCIWKIKKYIVNNVLQSLQRTCKYCLECVYKWITLNGVTWLKNKPQYLMQWLTLINVCGFAWTQHSVVEMLECWLDPVFWWGKPMTLRSRRESAVQGFKLAELIVLDANPGKWYSPLYLSCQLLKAATV